MYVSVGECRMGRVVCVCGCVCRVCVCVMCVCGGVGYRVCGGGKVCVC